jgi:hypothetical protein
MTKKNNLEKAAQLILQRKLLSDSFNRGKQTLDEATKSAHLMSASLEINGMLLHAPIRN